MNFQILIDRKSVFIGQFATWWDAYDSALSRAQMVQAHHVQVRAA